MSKNNKKLSATVLDMKFMRRTKNRLEEKEKRKKEAELQKEYLSGEGGAIEEGISGDGPSSSSDKYVFTRDLEFLEDLYFGRMSFKGYNPQVEKLMKYYVDKKNGKLDEDSSDEDKDVSDDEMAETMGGSLGRTIAGKFKRGQKRDNSLIDESVGGRHLQKRGTNEEGEDNRGAKAKRMW